MNVPSLIAGLAAGGSAGALLVWLQQTFARRRLARQMTDVDEALFANARRKDTNIGFSMSTDPEDTSDSRAPATFQVGGVCPSDRGDSLFHVGYVIFSYRVADKDYSSLCARPFLTHADAQALIEMCRSRTLTAQYRSERPQESCLAVNLDDTPEDGEQEGVAEAILTAVSPPS